MFADDVVVPELEDVVVAFERAAGVELEGFALLVALVDCDVDCEVGDDGVAADCAFALCAVPVPREPPAGAAPTDCAVASAEPIAVSKAIENTTADLRLIDVGSIDIGPTDGKRSDELSAVPT